jgi:hypothetical protein
MFKYLPSLLLLFFVACTSTSSPVSQSKVEELTVLLKSLDSSISFKEAKSLSNEIFRETGKLRKKFNPIPQAHFNNFLINTVVKKRGLCYDWSDALYLHFSKKEYASFEFHLLVSHKGKYFYEHNTLAVAAKGGNVLEGIVIDPWRNSGKLYFSKVGEDKKYEWRHRSRRGCQKGK